LVERDPEMVKESVASQDSMRCQFAHEPSPYCHHPVIFNEESDLVEIDWLAGATYYPAHVALFTLLYLQPQVLTDVGLEDTVG